MQGIYCFFLKKSEKWFLKLPKRIKNSATGCVETCFVLFWAYLKHARTVGGMAFEMFVFYPIFKCFSSQEDC